MLVINTEGMPDREKQTRCDITYMYYLLKNPKLIEKERFSVTRGVGWDRRNWRKGVRYDFQA